MDEALLKRIANHQMLRGSFCRDLGLLHGKMGLVLFFFHYGRHTGKALYDDFAGELLDEVIRGLHDEMPVRFSDGLSGIGWGIEYLIRNAFVEGHSGEILEELDFKLMGRDPRRITDFSFETGLGGIAYYVTFRLDASELSLTAFDPIYLNELKIALGEKPLATELDSQSVFARMTEVDLIKNELSWKQGLKMLVL